MGAERLISSLKVRLVVLVIGIFATLYMIFLYFANDFINSVEHDLGEKLVRQQVVMTRERALNYFNRDQKLIETGLANGAFQTWMKNPADDNAKIKAQETLDLACKVVNCYGWFMFSHRTLKGYDWNQSLDEIVSESIELDRDGWYVDMVSAGLDVYIDSSIHPITLQKGAYLDVIVRENGRLLGLVGTYTKIETMTNAILNHPSEGVTNFLVDNNRVIRGLPTTTANKNMTSISEFVDQPAKDAFGVRFMRQIDSEQQNKNTVFYSSTLDFSGSKYLVAFHYIDGLNWYAVSLFPLDQVNEKVDMLPLLVMSMLLLAAFITLTLYVLNRQLISPIVSINAVVSSISKGDYSKRINDIPTDVLKSLADGINNMAARISDNLADIKEKNDALEKAIENANKANKAKSIFLSNMSHELRTPLNAVLGFTKFGLDAKSAIDKTDFLHKIESAGNHLLKVINDLLDFNKIEMDEFALEQVPFKLNRVIHKVLSICQVKANAKQLQLIFDISSAIPKTLIGDPLRIEQILINLINNAAKFTESGDIRLAVNAEILSDSLVEIRMSVSDTGIGMSDEQLKRLFKPFTQADESITRKYGGTGLGLAISKQLVEAMDGEIRVTSQQGLGSTFSFTMQLQYSMAALPTEKLAPTFDLDSLKVMAKGLPTLMVEDNELNQTIAMGILAPLQLSIDVVDNGEKAVAQARGSHYSLILMDIQMPVMDGIEATRLIRQFNKDVFIIGLSAYGTKQDANDALDAGMNAYLTKPVNQQELFATIADRLNAQAKQSSADSPSRKLAR